MAKCSKCNEEVIKGVITDSLDDLNRVVAHWKVHIADKKVAVVKTASPVAVPMLSERHPSESPVTASL